MTTKQGGVRSLRKTLRQFGLTTIRVLIILSILLAQSPAALAQAQVLPADRAAAPAAGVFDSCAAQTEIPAAECEALAALYTATDGPNWTQNTDWLATDTPCSWYGVGCAEGAIQFLNLASNGLNGALPEELGSLSGLTSLQLNDNALSGQVPATMGNLTNLTSLNLQNTALSGSLPVELANLISLQVIAFDNTNVCMPVDTGFRDWVESIPSHAVTGYCADAAFVSCDMAAGVTADECAALTTFYNSTGGDNWTNSTNWFAGNDLCTWQGITCGEGHVAQFILQNNHLAGSLPAEVEDLGWLRKLVLENNQLSGAIPPDIGSLTDLMELDLGNNQFSGEVPASLGDLTGLTRLNLSGNSLSGSMPLSLLNLTLLEEIGFSETNLCMPLDQAWDAWLETIPTQAVTSTCSAGSFTGCAAAANIPESECGALAALYEAAGGSGWTDQAGWLANDTPCSWFGVGCSNGHVTSLVLSENNLTGSLPADVGDLTYLSELTLDHNALSGAIPAEVWTLSNLTKLSFWVNQFTGSIPPEAANLTQLKHLDVDDNQLSGDIPVELASMINLEELWLSNNRFTGTIPPQLGNLNNLTALGVGGNLLTGSVPPELGNLTRLEGLWLYGNQLTGSIPAQFGNLTALESLYLYGNQLSGTIPDSLLNLTGLIVLDLSQNQLSGGIPTGIGSWTNLKVLSLWGNRLTGSIPAQMGALTQLQRLYLAQNQLTGSVPAEIGNLINLKNLTLNSNGLSGSLPAGMSNLTAMESIDFAYTGLCMPVNEAFQNWIAGVPDKSVTTTCPTGAFTDCSHVTGVTSGECSALTGLFNSTAGPYWNDNSGWKANDAPCTWFGVYCVNGHVMALVLPDNSLQGPLPSSIGNLTYLTELSLGQNLLSGSIPTTIGNLKNLIYLDLYNNKLSGGIPSTMANLKNLEYLYLGFNDLSGAMPTWVAGFPNLVHLYLNGNLLTGSIPSGIGNLKYLEKLILADNKLTGAIPSQLGNLQNLTTLSLWSNDLSGTIPANLGNLTRLEELWLDDNLLTGSIPPQLGNLTNLTSLWMSSNQLTGMIPPALGNLTQLTELVLYNNRLTGYIPSEIGNLVQLKYLDLDANWLTANIPDEMLNLKNLEEFYFKYDGPCLTNKLVFHRWMQAIPSHSNYMICKSQTELDSVQPGYSFRGISIPKLVVAGYYFQPKSVVEWNANALQTTYFNPNKLTAEVPAEVIDEPGLIYVLVCTIDMVNICSYGKSHIILDFTPAYNQKLTTNKVTFDWDDVPGANLYTIQLSLSNSFSSNILYTTTSASKYAFGTALTNGKTYYWRIQARIGSTWGPWTSTAQFISMSPPAAPGLTAPAAGAFTNDTTVDLTWKTVTNGQVYQLQLSKSSTFGTPLVNETLAAGVMTYTTAELADGLYYWRVRAVDEVGVNGAWSAVRSFTVDTVAPGVPKLYTPKDDAYTADTTPDLSVTAVTGAKNYTYQLSASPDFSEIAWEKTGGLLVSASLQPYGVYYWRAKAVDAAGNPSDWCAARKLTLTFQSSPGLAAVTTDSTPTFVWTAVTGAKAYELRIYRQGEAEPLYIKSLGLVTTFTLPNTNALPIGYYQWSMSVKLASGMISTPLRDLTIKPAPPAAPGLSSLAAGAFTNDNTPTLSWKSVGVAIGYELWLDNGSAFTSREYQNTFEAGALEVTLESPLPDGVYYWKMRTLTEMGVLGPWSTVRSFTVDTLAPGVPKLYTPKNGASTADTTPDLTLTAVAGAKNYTYQLSSMEDFSVVAWEKTGGVMVSASFQPYGVYYWRAKAIDAAGNQSDWCAAWRLEISFLSSPKAGWYSTTRTPAFTWTAVGGAKSYQLRIYREGETEALYTKNLGLVTSFALPAANALTPGKYRWEMSVTLASGTFATTGRSFTLTDAYLPAPGLIMPANGAAMQNRTPELGWSAVAEAVVYEVWLDNGSGFTSREFSLITPETSVVLPTELPDATYYWKVRSIDDLDVPGPWSAVRTLKVDNIAPAVPKLYTPAGGAVVNGTPRFTWLAATGAKYYQFRLLLKSDGSVVRESADTLTGTGYTPAAVPVGEYQWQVRAGDAAGNWSGWGTGRSITIRPGTPAAPTLLSPQNASSTTDASPELDWSDVVYGDRYRLQISKRSDFSTVVLSVLLPAGVTTYTPGTDLAPGTYYWRVCARNVGGTLSAWSSTWRVIILAP